MVEVTECCVADVRKCCVAKVRMCCRCVVCMFASSCASVQVSAPEQCPQPVYYGDHCDAKLCTGPTVLVWISCEDDRCQEEVEDSSATTSFLFFFLSLLPYLLY